MPRFLLRFVGSSFLCVLFLAFALSAIPTAAAFLVVGSNIPFRTGRMPSLSWELMARKQKKGGTAATEKKGANHEKWQPYYEALSKYQEEHGHCEVDEDENPSLREWLDEQRASYQALQAGRKTKLTRKRAVALEMIAAIPMDML